MDWTRLSPSDFEDLVGDLLQADGVAKLERFGPGPDGGVDLRSGPASARTVVQCKHYLRSGWKAFHKEMKGEAKRLPTLRPARYIVATSLPLSPENKDTILATCSPFLRESADVLGGPDLEALLRSHPKIRGAHPKIWSESVDILIRLMHAGLFTATAWTREQAESDIKVFVRPAAYSEALRMLRDHHACVVGGPPGIGKTTLARMLLMQYVREGFEPIVLRNSVDEAFDLVDPAKRQVFFFDDFLGQTDISERSLGRNEDARIVRLVEKAAETAGMRVVLTTREYILRDALRIFEHLARAQTTGTLRAVTLNLASYARIERARLLYNHVWELDKGLVGRGTTLKEPAEWKRVVDHQGYNPRLVQMALRQAFSIGALSVAGHVASVLDNPKDLWRIAFLTHLDDVERLVLRTLVMHTFGAGYEVIFSEADRRHRHLGNSSLSRDKFNRAIGVMEGDFIALERSGDGTDCLRLANPSVRDFLLGDLNSDAMQLEAWLTGCTTPRDVADLCAAVAWGLWRAEDRNVPAKWIEGAAARITERAGATISSVRSPGASDIAASLDDIRQRLGSPAWFPGLVEGLGSALPALSHIVKPGAVRRLLGGVHLSAGARGCWLSAAAGAINEDWDDLREMVTWMRADAGFNDEHVETLNSLFYDIAESERDWARSDADDESGAMARLDEIDEVARLLGVASPVRSWDRAEVAEKFEARRERAEEYSEEVEDHRPAGPDAADQEITRLFHTFESPSGDVE